MEWFCIYIALNVTNPLGSLKFKDSATVAITASGGGSLIAAQCLKIQHQPCSKGETVFFMTQFQCLLIEFFFDRIIFTGHIKMYRHKGGTDT